MSSKISASEGLEKKLKKTNSGPDSVIHYNYVDYSAVDHRLKLHLHLSILDADEREVVQLLLKVGESDNFFTVFFLTWFICNSLLFPFFLCHNVLIYFFLNLVLGRSNCAHSINSISGNSFNIIPEIVFDENYWARGGGQCGSLDLQSCSGPERKPAVNNCPALEYWNQNCTSGVINQQFDYSFAGPAVHSKPFYFSKRLVDIRWYFTFFPFCKLLKSLFFLFFFLF